MDVQSARTTYAWTTPVDVSVATACLGYVGGRTVSRDRRYASATPEVMLSWSRGFTKGAGASPAVDQASLGHGASRTQDGHRHNRLRGSCLAYRWNEHGRGNRQYRAGRLSASCRHWSAFRCAGSARILSKDARTQIAGLQRSGVSEYGITRHLHRATSTISREPRRNATHAEGCIAPRSTSSAYMSTAKSSSWVLTRACQSGPRPVGARSSWARWWAGRSIQSLVM